MQAAYIVLRFRDLVTEPGGTILEHRTLLRRFGEVWWGWWMRQYETLPKEALGELKSRLERGEECRIVLFDSGRGQFFLAAVLDVATRPGDSGITGPELEKVPEYYRQGRYPAWFLLRNISDFAFPFGAMTFGAFPTRPGRAGLADRIGEPVWDADQLRNTDVTLWLMNGPDLGLG